MTQYATAADVAARMGRTFSQSDTDRGNLLLQDAAVIIDAFAKDAAASSKQVVSCRMVERVMAEAGGVAVPVGATQGSMSALGYSQSWTMGSVGSSGEIYLSRLDKRLLGLGDEIGSRSPVEDLVPPPPPEVPL